MHARLELIAVEQNGTLVPEDSDRQALFLEVIEGRQSQISNHYLAFLALHEVETTELLDSSFHEAKAFVEQLGLMPSASVHLIGAEGLDKNANAYQAAYLPQMDSIDVYLPTALKTASKLGNQALSQILVHELAHASRSGNYGLSMFPDGKSRWVYRDGFNVWDSAGNKRGRFYEEAFAEYCAGLYNRRRKDPDCRYISISDDNKIEKTLPDHYLFGANVAGLDGYCIEILAFAVEKKGVMKSDTFIEALFKSRDKETQAAGLRTIAYGINSLQPGLYKSLQNLTYSRENWLKAFDKVHETCISI